MRKFYVLRHEDVHNNSGTGVVSEGVLFDFFGWGAMIWLTDEPTLTLFGRGIKGIRRLHSHGGKTEVIIEGVKKDAKKFEHCQDAVRTMKSKRRNKSSQDETSQNETEE